METATLIFAGICAICGIVTAIPVVLPWFHQARDGAPKTYESSPSKSRWLSLALSICALVLSGVGLYRTVYVVPHQVSKFKIRNLEDLQIVYGKNFKDERVEIDGKNFENCTFENVTYVYNGTASVAFKDNTLIGSRVIDTDSDAVSGTVSLLHFMKLLDPNTPVFSRDVQGNITKEP
jgi:hypothetical protein